MTHEAADTKAHVQAYDLETYGPYVVYDDFFANFTASEFDAKDWVDLFDEAGAQYFVLTTKHHGKSPGPKFCSDADTDRWLCHV